jgi:membrane-associated phospholipid phosphatase
MFWRLLVGWGLVLGVVATMGLTLGALGREVGALRAEDGIDRALAAHRSPVLDDVTSGFSQLANTGAIIASMLVAAVALQRVLHRWRDSLFVAAATWGQSMVFLATTALVDRPRPRVTHLDSAPPTSSFPSGHTGAAIALYAALAVVVLRRTRRRWVRVVSVTLLAAVPVLVGLSRLYRGMHHPSDVAGSVVCAGLTLAVSYVVVLRRPLPEDE